MNNRLLCGLIVVATLSGGVLGCTSPTKRNGGLYSGGNSSLTAATNNTLRNVDNSQGGALGGLQIADKPSTAERLLSPLKSVGQSLTPQSIPDSTQDPLSLNNKPNAPTPDLFLSAARVVAGGGNIENARSLYEQALVADPSDRDALLELARLEIEAGDFEKATERYMQAVEAHPNDPIVFNDLGLFHAHREGWELSIKAFERAIELDGEKTLYRNNLAHTWVKVGQPQEALSQLAAVHPKPDAHFNLGYLLYTQKQLLPALEQFEMAYQADNQLQDAIMMRNQILDELQRRQPQGGPRQVVRPASFLQSSSDDSDDDVEVAQSSDREEVRNDEQSVASDGNEDSVARVQTPTQVAQELNDKSATANTATSSQEEESGPRIIVLDGNSEEDLEERVNRHTRLTDISIDDESKVASQEVQSTDSSMEPPILSPELAAQPIREVPQANPNMSDPYSGNTENGSRNETFAKYEKYWMPLSFYAAIEQSKSDGPQGAGQTAMESAEHVSTTSNGNEFEDADSKTDVTQPPALLPSGADESKPLRTSADSPLFDKRQPVGTYYPTTGAPAIVPK